MPIPPYLSSTRRCFLHIGVHKTGTTSIQHLLNSNRAALQSKGYYYPSAGQPNDLPGHHNIAWQLWGDLRFRDDLGTVEDLISEIIERPEHIILSSEDFSCAMELATDAFSNFVTRLQSAGFHVTIIVYLRNYLDWMVSVYLTLVTFGWDVAWHETVATRWEPAARAREIRGGMGGAPDQASLPRHFDELVQMARAIEMADVNVRSYEEAGGSICADFLSIVGLTLADVGLQEEIRLNQKGSLRQYLLVFAQNRARRELREDEQAAITALVPAEETRIMLSPRERRRLSKTFGVTEPTIHHDMDIGSPFYVDELFVSDFPAPAASR
jgi:hypothetical protein